jgi:hypothetical protein
MRVANPVRHININNTNPQGNIMLQFTLFSDSNRGSDKVHINPMAVISIEELESRDTYTYKKVAVIHLEGGISYKVLDNRSTADGYEHLGVAAEIKSARKSYIKNMNKD